MGKSSRTYAKGKESDTKVHKSYDSIYMNVQIREIQRQDVDQGLWGEGMGVRVDGE